VTKYDPKSAGLEGLLSLDGETMELGDGYWVKFRAKQVPPSVQRPHGLEYALTLHAPGARRLVGYDNAHVPNELKERSVKGRQTQTFDHVHYEGRRTRFYDFTTPGRLVEDFWESVDAKLKEEGSHE
jgi:hypothetical protein